MGCTIDRLRFRGDVGDQCHDLRLALREPRLQRLDVLHLAAQRVQQRSAGPPREVGRHQRADLVETEIRLLRGRDQVEHRHRFLRIRAIAVRFALDERQQTDAFVKADARRGQAGAFRQFPDLHVPILLGRIVSGHLCHLCRRDRQLPPDVDSQSDIYRLPVEWRADDARSNHFETQPRMALQALDVARVEHRRGRPEAAAAASLDAVADAILRETDRGLAEHFSR